MMIWKDGAIYIGKILEAFRDLTSLSLAFGNSHIGQVGYGVIIKKLFLLSHLTTLKLKLLFPDSWDDSANEIGRALESLPSIRSLALQVRAEPKSTQACCHFVSNLLSKCRQIDSFLISVKESHISSIHFAKITSALTKIDRLERLSIQAPQQNYNDSDIEVISLPLRRLTRLRDINLNLKRSNLGKIGAIHLAEVLSRLHDVTCLSLNLSSNPIEEIGFNLIIDAFRGKRLIKDFNFLASSCAIKGQLLFNFLKTCEDLETLSFRLNHNRITPKSLNSLCECVKDLGKPKLKKFGLSAQK